MISTATHHKLKTPCKLWAHLPHDPDWTINGYKSIQNWTTIEEVIALTESMPDELIKNCMFFVMKDGILPIYETPENAHGGCFSYKVPNKDVCATWRMIVYAFVGGVMSENLEFSRTITGITISPKKNWCIIKVWVSTCEMQNSALIHVSQDIPSLTAQPCLFKKHSPS